MDGIKKPEDTTPPQAPLPPAGESLENNPQPAPTTPPAAQPVVSAPQPAPDAAQTVSGAPAGKSKMWIIAGVVVLVVVAAVIFLLV